MDECFEDITVYRVGTRRGTCLEHSDDVFNININVVKGLLY